MEMEQLTQRIDEYPTTVEEEDLDRVRSLRKELQQLDDEFRMISNATVGENKPHVHGFHFPINSEEDIERLESAVRTDEDVRHQYIHYLSVIKPLRLSVVQAFSKFFTDEAMTNYNWHGLEKAEFPRTPKRGMQKYDIFCACMFAAWEGHGIDKESLIEQLKKTVYHINRRRYTRKQAMKKKFKTTE